MNTKIFIKYLLIVGTMLGCWTQTGFADTASEGLLHPWETPHFYEDLKRDFTNSSTIRFYLPEVECVDRIEVSVFSTSGRPTIFIAGGEAYNPEPLDQDIHAGTITVPVDKRDPNYRFRIDRMTKEVFLLIGGGEVRVTSALVVTVPDYYCPLMANHLAPGWAKQALNAYKTGSRESFSSDFRVFLENLKLAATALETVSDGTPGFQMSNYRLPDTNPDVLKAAGDLACIIAVQGSETTRELSEDTDIYKDVVKPLNEIKDIIASTYDLDLHQYCAGLERRAP